MIEVRKYRDANDDRGEFVGYYRSESSARRAAANALGRSSMRGAHHWRTETGRCYQFGRHDDTEPNPVVELIGV